MNRPTPKPDPSDSSPILARLVQEQLADEALDDAGVNAASAAGDASGAVPAENDEALAPRRGSPFASDPFTISPDRPVEVLIDGGPLRYTAMGAVAASAMVLVFAAVAAWWFPGGGTMIAALGCALSIFGMYSNYRFLASGFLLLHLALFVVSYGRSLS